MKYTESEEFSTRVCGICGEHIGRGADHSECSKEKKKMYGDSQKSKAPKKITTKAADYLARKYR